MNKIFTRVIGGALGLAMAVGVVSVAASNRKISPVQAGTSEISTTMTWGEVENENVFSWSNNGDTYLEIAYGGNSDIDLYATDFRMYLGTWFTLSAKTAYSSSVKIKTVAITGKSSKNTNYLYYNATTGQKVTESGEGVTSMSWDTSSTTNTADFGNGLSSVTIARATSGNQVRVTQMVVTFDYTTVSVTGVEIDGETHEVAAGEDLPLSATVTPSNATNKNVTWSISNLSPSGCATINANTGVLHGVEAGSGKVTVTTSDGSFTDTEDFAITSFIAVESVTLNKASTALYVAETETLKETVLPTDASNKTVAWESDNESVATVENGVVSAVAAGTAHITVTSVSDGTKSASCTVTVSNRAVTSISLNKSTTSIVKGGTETLVATINPDNATIKTVTWETSDSTKATVSNGVVTAVAQGEAVISAKADGYISDKDTPDLIAKCTVTITDVVITGHKYVLISEYQIETVTYREVLTGMYLNDKGTTAYGIRTEYYNFPTTSYQIEIVTGHQSGTYGLKLSNNKYLGYSSTYGNNSLHEFDGLDDAQSWNISVSGGNYLISPYGADSRTIQYNATSGQERFSTYTSSQKPVKLVEVNDESIVGNFIETKLHLHDYEGTEGQPGSGYCKDNEHNYYDKEGTTGAKYAFNHLSETQRGIFLNDGYTQFATARKRLLAWAAANGETIGNDATLGNNVLVAGSGLSIIITDRKVDYTALIIIISSISLVALGGFLVIRRKKEQ